MSSYALKRQKQAEFALNKELDTGGDSIDADGVMALAVRGAAMGEGDEELFEKKMTKEEKKAAQKAAREAKKKAKAKAKGNDKPEEVSEAKKALEAVKLADKRAEMNSVGAKREAALEQLSKDNIIVTYAQEKKAPAATNKDINVSSMTVTFHGKVMIEVSQYLKIFFGLLSYYFFPLFLTISLSLSPFPRENRTLT